MQLNLCTSHSGPSNQASSQVKHDSKCSIRSYMQCVLYAGTCKFEIYKQKLYWTNDTHNYVSCIESPSLL